MKFITVTKFEPILSDEKIVINTDKIVCMETITGEENYRKKYNGLTRIYINDFESSEIVKESIEEILNMINKKKYLI